MRADPPKTLILADTYGSVEARLVREWAEDEHPGARVVPLDGAEADAALRSADSGTELVPARVTWLPRQRSSGRRLRFWDLLFLVRPVWPVRLLQSRIGRRHPERALVTAGQPAWLGELRLRYEEDHYLHDEEAFSAFVRYQALVAIDRTEREVIGNRYKVPRLVAERLAHSRRFDTGLREVAEQLDRSIDEVRTEALEDLEGLVTVQSNVAMEAFRSAIRPLHEYAWDVDVDDEAFDRLRTLHRDHPLVFLPSHRSYVDSLTLADALLEHDLPHNVIFGGDNLAFWPMAPIARRAGVVFIRRSFGDDEVYKFVFRRYLAYLLEKRFNLEWFIEGGRTRTGKLRPPRYGMLRYLVDALEMAPKVDPVIVPVSLVYEQLHEVWPMAAEERGARKRPEGLRWLFDYGRRQREHLGSVKVRFGEPIPLRRALEESGEGRARIEKVAFMVGDHINAVTPATATSLVSLALLVERNRALTLGQVAQIVEPLLRYLEVRGIEAPSDDLRDDVRIGKTLRRLERAGVVEAYDGGADEVWWVRPEAHLIAAYYRNASIHHFLTRAVAEVAVVAAGPRPPAERRDAAWQCALALRDLLKFDFYFARKRDYLEDLLREASLLSPEWEEIVVADDLVDRLLGHADVLLAHQVLRSFFHTQLVVAEYLTALGGGAAPDREELIRDCLGLGRQMHLQGRIHGESLARELFDSALKVADSRELLRAGDDDPDGELQTRRLAYCDELSDVLGRLDAIERLDEVRRSRQG